MTIKKRNLDAAILASLDAIAFLDESIRLVGDAGFDRAHTVLNDLHVARDMTERSMASCRRYLKGMKD